MQSASLRTGGSKYGGRTGPWHSLPSWPTSVDVIGPDSVQALTYHSHRLPGGEWEAPRHHAGSCRQLCLQLVLQQWELWETGEGGIGRGDMAPPSSSSRSVPTLGMAWASQGVSEPQTYHTRSQEHRHIVAVPQAHLQEEEVTPAGKEVWWAWSHHSFQGPAPARQVTEALGAVSRAAKPELEAWRSGVGSEGVQGPWVTFQRSSRWKRTLPIQPALQARSRASPTSQGFSS